MNDHEERIPYNVLEEIFSESKVEPNMVTLHDSYKESRLTLEKANKAYLDARAQLDRARLTLVKALKPGDAIDILYENDPVEFVGYDPAVGIIYNAYGVEKERAINWFQGLPGTNELSK